MEKLVKQKYVNKLLGKGKLYCPKVNLVRYADDFVVTADKRETLEEIKILLTGFLAERGLTLSEEKTLITSISKGFDFLGFNIRKYNGKLLIKPSKKSQKKFTDRTHEIIFSHKAAAQHVLIERLNPVLRGWGNYFKQVVSKEVFSKLDHILVLQLKRWAFRRHNNKSKRWALDKYFKSEGSRNRIFRQTVKEMGNKSKRSFTLNKLSDIPINRYLKIKKGRKSFRPGLDCLF